MSFWDVSVGWHARRWAWVFVLASAMSVAGAVAEAQVLTNTRAVGGVAIDARGIVTCVDLARSGDLEKIRLEAVPDGLGQVSPLRKVSLRGLHAAIEEHLRDGKALPDAIQCLAGLQQVRYVFVFPEQNDVVLAGYGEGWKLDRRGNVVGATTGRPVMLLDDFLTALRTLGGNARGPMSCSIDPTPEGLQRLSAFARQQRTIGSSPGAMGEAVESTLGPQKISVQGLPETSHFARVMVAADYRMKRISMGLEPSPVRDLPRFMDLMGASGRGMSNMLPRWWLEPNYQSLLRDAQGLSWEIRGGSVKAMAENDFFDANGIQHPSGKADAASQRWADSMTRHYDQLAAAEPVFGQLRNCMDLSVVAALIAKENLLEKAGLRLPQLTGSDGVPVARLEPAKQVASEASLAKKGRNWMIAAGGVSLNPWSIVEKAETSETLTAARPKAPAKPGATWWWD